MYEAFYGLAKKPFTLNPDPAFLYLSPSHLSALKLLEYGLSNEHGFTLVTGDVGSGKTTLIRALLNRIPDDVKVGLISNTHSSFGNLLQWVCLAYGLEFGKRDQAELHDSFVRLLIAEFAAGRRTVLIIDEAQNLTTAALEELRVLSNINADAHLVLQIVLVGQPELREKLRLVELRQFAQRIGAEHRLGLLTRGDTRNYVQHRLEVAGGSRELFSVPAIDLAGWEARGVPRLINQLCDAALVQGFGEHAERIGVRLMHAVIQARCNDGVFPGRSREWDRDNPAAEGI